MPSEKIINLLLSEGILTKNELVNLTEKQAWDLVFMLETIKEEPKKISFLGFPVGARECLENIAKINNLDVKKHTDKNLHFLCVGEDACPLMLEEAMKNDALIINIDGFVDLIENGS